MPSTVVFRPIWRSASPVRFIPDVADFQLSRESSIWKSFDILTPDHEAHCRRHVRGHAGPIKVAPRDQQVADDLFQPVVRVPSLGNPAPRFPFAL